MTTDREYYSDRFVTVPDNPEVRAGLTAIRNHYMKMYPGAAPLSESLIHNYTRPTDPSHRWGFTHEQRTQGKYLPIFGMVATHKLVPYQEYDRTKEEGGRMNIERIKDWMSGSMGHHEPLWVDYNHGASYGFLSEGNHRLAAAIQLGHTHVPVVIGRNGYSTKESRRGAGGFLQANGGLMIPDEYYSHLAGHHVPFLPPEMHPTLFPQLRGDR